MSSSAKTPATLVTVPADDAGRRIDNFLGSRLKDVPKSRIYRMLRSGEVRVNGGRAKPDRRLAADDQVRIPPLLVIADAAGAPLIPVAVLAELAGTILHEDDRIIVINKPAGIAVHSGSGLRWGVVDVMRALRPHAPLLELVHRIDRDTSGCLVLAKDMPTLRRLHEAMRTHDVDKHYVALVQGRWPDAIRQINAPLLRVPRGAADRKVSVDDDGKPAQTSVIALEPLRNATLVHFELHTGRTHQVRVHAASIGHPLAGDRKYGDPAFNALLAGCGLQRMFLHAERITLRPAEHLAPITISAGLPAELRSVLKALRDA